VLWLLLSIAGVADQPENWALAGGVWIGYLVGPVTLIFGAGIVLRFPSSNFGSLSVVVGCLWLTGFAIYNTIGGLHREPLQAPPSYWFYHLMIVITVLADFAAYTLIRPSLAAASRRRFFPW
jgi:hypothetical protein